MNAAGIIAHNIAAQFTYNRIDQNNRKQTKTLEKLSSGFRINSSADDAAGLAISESMRQRIQGLDQGDRNINDGIGLIQTADGALTEIHSMLNRMTTLATQSANGTYNDDVRKDIEDEVTALKNEIDRIAENTSYGGVNMLSAVTNASSFEDTHAGITDWGVSGIPTDESIRKYQFSADENGISINGTQQKYDSIISIDGTSTLDSLAPGDYKTSFNGLNFTFKLTDNSTLSDVINSVNGITAETHGYDKSYKYHILSAMEIVSQKKEDIEDFYSPGSVHSFSVNGNTLTLDGKYSATLGTEAFPETQFNFNKADIAETGKFDANGEFSYRMFSFEDGIRQHTPILFLYNQDKTAYVRLRQLCIGIDNYQAYLDSVKYLV